MPAESKKLDTKCLEPFGGKSGGWVLLQLIVYIEIFFGDTMKISPILKKGNVTILTFLTHDEQITYSYDV